MDGVVNERIENLSDAIDVGGDFFELKRLFDEEVRRVEALMIEKRPAAFSPKLDAAAVALAFLFNGERIGYAKDVFSHATKFIDLSHSVHADVFNLWLKADGVSDDVCGGDIRDEARKD